MNKTKSNTKAIIYARCSTDEDRQDVDKQIKECKTYCQNSNWKFEVVYEYLSGFKQIKRPKFEVLLEKIRKKQYTVMIVYDLSRFSRQQPHIANEELDRIVHKYGCRFISLNDNIDSDDDIKWNVVRQIMVWQSHNYSKNLSQSIKSGIRNKKDKGIYSGGRPKITEKINKFDVLKAYQKGGSYREAEKILKKEGYKISYISVQRIVKKNNSVLRD